MMAVSAAATRNGRSWAWHIALFPRRASRMFSQCIWIVGP
jgi:hypothetical protein